MHQTITIHACAPAKPAVGEPCNGCGVCCAAEPCPIGVLVSARRNGRCSALWWDDGSKQHRCGMVSHPERFIGLRAGWITHGVAALSSRLISAGQGCDSDAQVID